MTSFASIKTKNDKLFQEYRTIFKPSLSGSKLLCQIKKMTNSLMLLLAIGLSASAVYFLIKAIYKSLSSNIL